LKSKFIEKRELRKGKIKRRISGKLTFQQVPFPARFLFFYFIDFAGLELNIHCTVSPVFSDSASILILDTVVL
jgi:hypothetical protein